MEYRVLGKLEVLRDGDPVDLGAFRQRALLALLLTSPNTVWSTDQIIDGLWGDDVGADRQNALWVHVSGLRKALEPEREKRTDGTILLTRPPGYLVEIDPDDIDAVRFERLVVEGRSLAETDPAAASLALGEALALWRGRAYEDFTYESFAQTEIARLEELRLEAVGARIDADLQRGLSRELVSELETLVRQHPLREELTGQLMLALYRSGRQAEALRAYQLLQSQLGDELGIEPSNRLRRLEEQIVTGDEALDIGAAGAPAGGAVPGLAVRGYELREQIGEGAFGVAYRAFQPAVGREVAIKVIRPELANDPAFIRRFEAEAQLVARLEHPHIVPLYDYWREPDAAYLVMRLMRGGSLADVLAGSALTAERATTVVDQLGSALETAHRAGVVHRDIKPANILIDDEGNAYLSDFGIAVGADGEPSDDGSGISTAGPPYASPEQLDRGPVTAASDIFSLAVVMAQALTGLRGEIGQISGALAPEVLRVVDRATAADADRRHGHVAEFVGDLRRALGVSEPAPPVEEVEFDNPYKGLRAFGAADAADFHGRERLVERLLARLGAPGVRGRFVAVVGPSGSGKSSVVKAGLLPALRRGAIPQSDRWFTVEMAPAPHPFESLEEALLGVAVDPPASLLEQLVGDHGLQKAVQRVLPADGSQLLLVVDQFEELFTQVSPSIATSFLDALVDAVNDEHSRIRVVVTLRADFYDRPLRHRGIGELLHDGTQIITPMTPEELERAISGPVETMGVTFEPALVAELVRDVVDRAGALPLLQYTLTELFDRRQGVRVTDATYREIGGVSGALVQRAEGLLAGLGNEAHFVARQVFLRLVTLGEGADDTRRRVLQGELEQLAVDRAMLRAVLDTFGRHRLLSFDRDPVTRSPTVEISHEALLTEWTRLREWIDGARHDVRNQRRLAEAMAEWTAADHSDQYLLRGGRLEQLHGWATSTSLPLSEPERHFLDASVAERERAADEEREREQRAVEAERRERQRARQVVGLGAIGVVIALLAVFGIVQWRSASGAKADTESLLTVSELVAASEVAYASDDQELALLYAVQAVRETVDLGFANEDAVDAVHWALHQLSVQYDVTPETPVAIRSGPNGLAGVYALPPAELVEFAETAVDRTLTDEECEPIYDGPCPDRAQLPADLPLRSGMEAYGAVPNGPMALAGTRVTVAAPALRAEPGLERQYEDFEALTGIEIDVVSNTGEGLLALASGNLDLPDTITWGGKLPEWTRPRVLDLGRFLDHDTLRADFGNYTLNVSVSDDASSLAEPNEVAYGLPVDADLKGVVFYPKAAFNAAGYEVPATWDELFALSRRIVDDGRSPWCVAFESGFPFNGWPGTDLIESMVLISGGADVYDGWSDGRIAFTDPAVVEGARLADSLLFEPGFVRVGPEAISNENFTEQMFNLLQRDTATGEIDPDCWLFFQGDFMLGAVPPGTVIGQDVDFFPMPPLELGGATPVIGSVFSQYGLVDRPEVRRFLEYVADPAWGAVWATEPGNGFISLNQRFDAGVFAATAADDPSSAVRGRLYEQTRDALAGGTFRLDASDLMPPVIGGWIDDPPTQSAFYAGMNDWVDGVRTIDQVLADIETAWEALRAEGG
ncbi:MAG: extracellular solute-binding protein [Ilumatobacter sp.]|uniref:extracellular solute-binding protein n=1 Tax=Ilumatobacter sp. TaxID=1967498 RepID=UPI00263701AB|nr:extracellular solute-binding protein [Ilumatobacter sp.]MDJ0767817.1 extracellular solute-binding protein [Ilumatobacter sp.]